MNVSPRKKIRLKFESQPNACRKLSIKPWSFCSHKEERTMGEEEKKEASSLSSNDSTPIVSRDNGHCPATKAKQPKYWRKSYCSRPWFAKDAKKGGGGMVELNISKFNLSPCNPVTGPNGHVSAATWTASEESRRWRSSRISRTSAPFLARPRGNPDSLSTIPNLVSIGPLFTRHISNHNERGDNLFDLVGRRLYHPR